jgi:hypothetical protein
MNSSDNTVDVSDEVWSDKDYLYRLLDDPLIKKLQLINKLTRSYRSDTSENVDDIVDAVKFALELPGFSEFLQEQGKENLTTSDECNTVIDDLFWWFLANKDYASAGLVTWGEDLFTPLPRSVRLIWKAIEENSLVNVLGSSSAGKTFSSAAWCLLDWCLDPEYTAVFLLANKVDALKTNLFADIQRLHRESLVKLPGVCDTESISVDKKTGMGFFTQSVRQGEEDKTGSMKGKKLKPRPNHPMFGNKSRLRILVDEAEEVPPGFFKQLANIIAGIQGVAGVEHGKIIMAANPSNRSSGFANCCEPEAGWASLDLAQDVWVSKSEYVCVRLNAMRSENVVQRRDVFPGFYSYRTLQQNLKSCNNDWDEPKMWTYVLGMYPPKGDKSSLIHPDRISASQKEYLFVGETKKFASCDPAFIGDDAAFAYGRAGKAVAYKDFSGNIIKLETPKYALQVDDIIILNKGDTLAVSSEVMGKCKDLGVREAAHLGVDSTGQFGVRDVINQQWNSRVLGYSDRSPLSSEKVEITSIIYSARPTETPILTEDVNTPRESYLNMASELWYATAKWFAADAIGIGRNVSARVFSELSSRKGITGSRARKSRVESKEEYKSRGNKSPDMADAFTMLVQTARLNCGWTPGLIEESVEAEEEPEVEFTGLQMETSVDFLGVTKEEQYKYTD